VAIFYLHSHSGEVPVATRLPTTLFILDSEPVRVDPALWKTLEWRDDAGSLQPAPPVGTPVRGLYTRLEWSR
jgi:hypothetical protein